jgi:hypothetical protein
MILPTKHIAPKNSLLGIGSGLLTLLVHEQTVTRLWDRARMTNHVLTFQRFILALDLLFAFGAIELVDGVLRRRSPQ